MGEDTSGPIVIIDRTTREEEQPAAYGLAALASAMGARGIPVLWARDADQAGGGIAIAAGPASDPLIRRWLAHEAEAIDDPGETVILSRSPEAGVWVASGTNERALMYALLELADAVEAEGRAAFSHLERRVERPDNRVRGMDRFLMGPLDEAWWHSDAFWAYYLDRLAHCRFNRLVLIAGFDTAYLSPPYPYFVQAAGYPDVRVVDLDEEQRERNLERLRAIGRGCHRRAIEFVLGTWQQRPWTANQALQVEGLPEGEQALGQYCAAGLETLLRSCEEIDGVQFRVNFEAGLGDQRSNEAFWWQLIDAVARCGRPVRLDLRAKGLTDGMIAYAQARGLEIAVPTKYWCEQTGLPHHLTQMRSEELTRLDNLNHSRRYSYADLLRKPRRFDVLYRLWTLGSTTLFLWGDPDYVRRFSASCRAVEGAGFEVAAPLSLKGGHAGLQDEPWPILHDPALRMGAWEDERYWPFYLLFGRIGYAADTPPWVWERAFRAHYPEEAALSLARGLEAASKILPLITAFHMPMHPMLVYWPELSTGGALFAEHNHNRSYNHTRHYGDVSYGSTEPSDPGLFYGIDAYAHDRWHGAIEARYTPLQVRDWLRAFAGEARAAVAQADRAIAQADRAVTPSRAVSQGHEYRAARVDLLMLADLAAYHASKVEAALSLALSREAAHAGQQAEAGAYLSQALRHCVEARDHWAALSARGKAAYHHPLQFNAGHGTARSGTWADRTVELEADVATLEARLEAALEGGRESAQADKLPATGSEAAEPPRLQVDVPAAWRAGRDLAVAVAVSGRKRLLDGLMLRYRHTNQLEGPFERIKMVETANGYEATIPGTYIQQEWDLLIYVAGLLSPQQALIYPGLYSPVSDLPYWVVRIEG
ncbi:MAG: hypothetical protein ACK2VD_04255 [Anaerolineae bacterium]